MLPRSKRVTTSLFSEIMLKGRPFHTPLASLYLIADKSIGRFSVSVPKKTSKTAVERNKIRRRVYSVLEKLEKFNGHSLSGFRGVIVMKNGSQKLAFSALSDEIKKVFVKSGILK